VSPGTSGGVGNGTGTGKSGPVLGTSGILGGLMCPSSDGLVSISGLLGSSGTSGGTEGGSLLLEYLLRNSSGFLPGISGGILDWLWTSNRHTSEIRPGFP